MKDAWKLLLDQALMYLVDNGVSDVAIVDTVLDGRGYSLELREKVSKLLVEEMSK